MKTTGQAIHDVLEMHKEDYIDALQHLENPGAHFNKLRAKIKLKSNKEFHEDVIRKAEALEKALGILTGLNQGGRMVGIISHVPELKRRIPARIDVSSSGAGSTTRVVIP